MNNRYKPGNVFIVVGNGILIVGHITKKVLVNENLDTGYTYTVSIVQSIFNKDYQKLNQPFI